MEGNTNNTLKRQREEEENEKLIKELEEDLKRHKSYKDMITLLDVQEDDDLSFLFSTLQEDLSFGSSSGSDIEEGEKVMRHLLEASDDELGIPSTDGFDSIADGHVDGGDLVFPVGESQWEFEDHLEAANYCYNLLESL